MAILDEVNVPDLDQLYRRQFLAPSPRRGDAQPASLAVILERVEVAVEVVGAALTAADVADRHRL